MNTEQKNQVLKDIYEEAIKTIKEAAANRGKALHSYDIYLYTVEKTLKIFNKDFKIEKDLSLVARGLNKDILRYITRLDLDSQKQQLEFYKDIKNSL